MAFYINDQIVDLNTIRMVNDKWYDGPDEVKKMLAGAWKEIENRFISKGQPIVFITPGIKSGGGKGNQGYKYPRVTTVKTRKGKVKVAWAEDQYVENGKTLYRPVSRDIGPNEKTLRLNPQEDIEEILFMFLFNPFLIGPAHPSGKTYLEDKEAEAEKYAETETNSAIISYWLYRKESPFYANDTKVTTLCLAWGINPDGRSLVYKKQLLAEDVKKAERRNDKEYGLDALNAACERLKEGQDVRDIEAMALIQQSIQKRIIRFDEDRVAWMLLGGEGSPLKTLCKVPPQQVTQNRQVLSRYLIANPEDLHTLESAVGAEQGPGRQEVAELTVELPEDVTEEYILNVMNWTDKRNIYKYLGYDVRKSTLETINPVLIEYFIIQGKRLPWVLKK
jgi:hypothetical protein